MPRSFAQVQTAPSLAHPRIPQASSSIRYWVDATELVAMSLDGVGSGSTFRRWAGGYV